MFQAAGWEPGKVAPKTAFAGPRPTGWKTRGTILKVLFTVLMEGGVTRTAPLPCTKMHFVYGYSVP